MSDSGIEKDFYIKTNNNLGIIFQSKLISRFLFCCLSSEVNQEDGDVGGGDAGDEGGLGDAGGAVALELLAALDGEGLDAVEVEICRNLDILEAGVLFCLKAFALDVAGVFDCDFYGLNYIF